jgi:hypothetical protein
VINSPTGLGAAVDALERATERKYVWTPQTRELAERSDAIANAARIASGTPALLLIHGAEDTVVAPGGVTLLGDALKPFYHQTGNDGRLKVVLASGISHDWTEPHALSQLRISVASWLNSNL